jgi:hypothetical protein
MPSGSAAAVGIGFAWHRLGRRSIIPVKGVPQGEAYAD